MIEVRPWLTSFRLEEPARFPNLAGVAYGGHDITYFSELITRLGHRLEIHCAGPENGLNSLVLGANGFMGGDGNFSPEMVQFVITSWRNQDLFGMRKAFARLMAFAKLYRRFGAIRRAG